MTVFVMGVAVWLAACAGAGALLVRRPEVLLEIIGIKGEI